MLPRTGSLTHLIVGTLLAVSTGVLTQSNPDCVFQSIQSAAKGLDIHFDPQDFGRTFVLFNGGVDPENPVASLCEQPRQ